MFNKAKEGGGIYMNNSVISYIRNENIIIYN